MNDAGQLQGVYLSDGRRGATMMSNNHDKDTETDCIPTSRWEPRLRTSFPAEIDTSLCTA